MTIFDIHKIKSSDVNTAQDVLSKEFDQVAKDKWATLDVGAFICYLGKDGKMRRGGFIKDINMQTGLIKLHAAKIDWIVKLSNIEKIWVNPTRVQSTVDSSWKKEVDELRAELDEYKSALQTLVISHQQLKNDVTSLVARLSRR